LREIKSPPKATSRIRSKFPRLRFTGGVARVNIGAVAMTRSDWPGVLRVIQGLGRNHTRVSELAMRNKGPRSLLIKNLDVYVVHAGNGYACAAVRPSRSTRLRTNDCDRGGEGRIDARCEYEEKVKGVIS